MGEAMNDLIRTMMDIAGARITPQEEAELPKVYENVPLPTLSEEEVDQMAEEMGEGACHSFKLNPGDIPDERYVQLLRELSRRSA